MTTNQNTPLWLELRKEYIDDNLEQLQSYLLRCSQNKQNDSFYNVTIDLLRRRVEDLLNSLAERPIYEEDDDARDHSFNVKLLALYLLADPDYRLSIQAYVAFMGELKRSNPKFSDDLLENAIKRLTHHDISALGYTWADLSSIGTDLFAYKASQATFERPLSKPLAFAKYGTAILNKNGLYLTHETEDAAKTLLKVGANSIDTGIGVSLRTAIPQKLKQSLDNSIPGMMEYTNDFMYWMCRTKDASSKKKLKVYNEGDTVLVRITSISYSGTVRVVTVDPQYERIEGTIKYEMDSLVYYYTRTLYRDFEEGNYFMATLSSIARKTFCIDKQFVQFLVDETKAAAQTQDDFLAKLFDIREQYYGWFNEYGVAMYTKNTGEYDRGDFAYLTIDYFGSGVQYGKIYAEIQGPSDGEYFEEKDVRSECVRLFATHTKAPEKTEDEDADNRINSIVLHLLLRQMFTHQKTLMKPSERCRFLINAYIMAELVGDDLSASYIKFASTYLRVLVQFVCNEDIKSLELDPEPEYQGARSTLIRLSVVQLLKEYGRKDNSEVLAKTIEDFKDSIPTLARLARLIQTANSMRGTLSDAAVNVIRREIIKTLSLETENDTDLEADSGSYLGIESGTQEFKTSMVYAPNSNMQPDEFSQNINVLKGICAFLNSTTGGVLYLGVNDQGYVKGIANDMKYLKQQSIDSYMRYVQDIAKKHLGIDALPFLRIEPLYDNTVVAIHVDPHPYRVVELLGIAYLRVNAESRQMPEKVRQDLIKRKMLTDKTQAAAISQLQHACSQQKCVILHNYASSNSGSVRDRMVEAYDIRPEDGLVVCYDRNTASDRKVKLFNISRIGYVEILDNEPWKFPALHEPVEVDAFHMSGDTPIHVALQLDLFSKNLLVESYPGTKNSLKCHKGDENIWYYDAKVFAIEPIARFYLGLANRIQILDSPELKSYVTQFVRNNLSD